MNPPAFYPDNYHGCLSPWISDIEQLHRRGLSPRDIWAQIYPRLQAEWIPTHYPNYSNDPDYPLPSPGLIAYVVRRCSHPVVLASKPLDHPIARSQPNRSDAAREALAMHLAGAKLRDIAVAFGLSGRETARLLVLKGKRLTATAEHNQRAIERLNRLYAEAEERAREAEERARFSKGRPIDMGGPRDQWIDRDPWC